MDDQDGRHSVWDLPMFLDTNGLEPRGLTPPRTMAASGIAEHNEARRKEMCLQKQAFKKRELMSNLREQFGDNPDLMAMQDSYTQEVNQTRRQGSPAGKAGSGIRHDAAYVDQHRRNQLRNEQLCEYTAKIPNRFNSVDYVAQW